MVRDPKTEEVENEDVENEDAEELEKQDEEDQVNEGKDKAALIAKVTKKGKLVLGGDVIVKYTGKKDLPKETFNSKNKVTKPGDPMHFVARHGDCYKLIRVYRAGGIKHSLVMMVKPKTRVGHKQLLQRLKKMEIPGAM